MLLAVGQTKEVTIHFPPCLIKNIVEGSCLQKGQQP